MTPDRTHIPNNPIIEHKITTNPDHSHPKYTMPQTLHALPVTPQIKIRNFAEIAVLPPTLQMNAVETKKTK